LRIQRRNIGAGSTANCRYPFRFIGQSENGNGRQNDVGFTIRSGVAAGRYRCNRGFLRLATAGLLCGFGQLARSANLGGSAHHITRCCVGVCTVIVFAVIVSFALTFKALTRLHCGGGSGMTVRKVVVTEESRADRLRHPSENRQQHPSCIASLQLLEPPVQVSHLQTRFKTRYIFVSRK